MNIRKLYLLIGVVGFAGALAMGHAAIETNKVSAYSKKRPKGNRAMGYGNPPVPAASTDGKVFVIKLRFHVLKSDKVAILNSTWTEADARRYVKDANQIWEPAKIRFEIEKVLIEPAVNLEEFAKVANIIAQDKEKGKRDKQFHKRKQAARDGTFPLDSRINKGIDVYVHRNLLNAAGVFSCDQQAVLIGQMGKRLNKRTPPSVLAHELGHSLGLRHTSCSDSGNLMMSGCKKGKKRRKWTGNPTLTQSQIDLARRWAATGGPQDCGRNREGIED